MPGNAKRCSGIFGIAKHAKDKNKDKNKNKDKKERERKALPLFLSHFVSLPLSLCRKRMMAGHSASGVAATARIKFFSTCEAPPPRIRLR